MFSQVSQATATEIFQATVGQSTSRRWFEERRWRLTASRFGEIVKLTERRDMEKLCCSLTSSHQHVNTPALAHGRSQETTAKKLYEEVTPYMF